MSKYNVTYMIKILWRKGMDARQIAEETGASIKYVKLKIAQFEEDERDKELMNNAN